MAKLDSLYFELEMRDKGLDAAAARAAAAIRQVDVAAQKTTDAFNRLRGAEDAAGASAKKAGQAFTEAGRHASTQARSFQGVGKLLTDSIKPEELKRRLDAAFRGGQQTAQKSGEEIAKSLTKGLRQNFAFESASIREELARGLITPQQAEQRGRAAAVAFNRGILATIQTAGNAGKLQGQSGQGLFVALTDQFRNVDANGQKAKISLTKLREPLTSLATQALGAKAGVGQLATSLASIGLGTGLTLGITAAIGAIVLGWRKLTETSRAAKERVDDLVKSLVAAGKQRVDIQVRLTLNRKEVEDRIKELQRQVRESRSAGAFGNPLAVFLGPDRERRLAETRGTLSEIDAQKFEKAQEGLRKRDQLLLKLLETDRASAAQKQLATDIERQYEAALKNTVGTSEHEVAIQERQIDFLKGLGDLRRKDGRDAESEAKKRADLTRDLADAVRVVDRHLAEAGKSWDKAFSQPGVQRARQLREIFAGLTATSVDDLRVGLEQLQASLREMEAPESFIQQVTDIQEAVIKSTEEAENLTKFLDNVRTSGLPPMRQLLELDKERTSLQGELDSLTKSDEASIVRRAALTARIKAIDEERERIGQGNAKNLTEAVHSSTLLASVLADAASAAFGIATALLGADANATRLIGSVQQVVGGFARIAELADAAEGLGKLLSTQAGVTSVLGPLGAIIGGGAALASLIGSVKDPEAAERLRLLEENNKRLAELRDGLDDAVRLSVSGRIAGAVLSVRFRGDSPGRPGAGIARDVDAILADLTKLGIGMSDLRKVASDLGLTIKGAVPTIDELDAIKEGVRLQGFREFISGLRTQLEVLDAVARGEGASATEQLRRRSEIVKGAVPLFDEIIAGIDLTTAEGRAQAKQRAVDQLKGLKDLTPDDLAKLGDFSPAEFFQFIVGFIEDLIRLEPAAVTALEKFQHRLSFLQEKFDLLGTSLGDQLPELLALFKEQFGEQFSGITLGSSVEDIRSRAAAFHDLATADGEISEAERAVLDAFRTIIAGFEAVADEATRAAADAAAARTDALARVRRRLSLTDLDQNAQAVLDALIATFTKTIPSLAPLLQEFAGKDLDETIVKILNAIENGVIDVAALGVPLEEFLDALSEIEGASDAATAALQKVADTLSEAFSNIDIETRLLGGDRLSPDVLRRKLGTLFPSTGGLSDLTTVQGISDTVALLRWAIGQTSDPDRKRALEGLLADLLDALDKMRAGGDAAGNSGVANAPTPRDTTIAGTGIGTVTELQAFSLVDIGRTQIEIQRDILAAILSSRHVVPISAPSLPPELFGGVGSGVRNDITVQVQFYGDVTLGDADALGQKIGNAAVPVINRALGRQYRVDQRRVGRTDTI